MAGGKVWVAPLISMVAERRGRSWRTTLRMARPVRFWVSRATARAVNTMVRCASIASRVRWNMGRAARSVLDIRKDCSTCHRSWWQLITSAGGMRVAGMLVTYPFRPARRRARARADSSRARAAFAPATTSRARFSWVVGVVLSRTKRLRENAHTARHEGRVPVGVPDRFGPHGRVVVVVRAGLGGEGVEGRPASKPFPVPGEWAAKIDRRLRHADPTMNPRPA